MSITYLKRTVAYLSVRTCSLHPMVVIAASVCVRACACVRE